MRLFFLATIFVISSLLTSPAQAQSAEGEVLAQPICFGVRNEAAHMVNGSFNTNFFTRPDGQRARHRSNFRLMARGSRDETGKQTDRQEFCSSGPFYPGRKLQFTLRSFFPIFDCKTRVQGLEIVVKSEPRPDGGRRIWAECFE